MKFAVYANCQGPQLAEFLSSVPGFSAVYEHVPLPACHIITEAEIDSFINIIQSIDLFIYIPIHDGYRGSEKFSSNYLLSLLKPSCVKIAFPSLYFHVYDQHMGYVENEAGQRIEQPAPYHDLELARIFAWRHHETDERLAARYHQRVGNNETLDADQIREKVAIALHDLGTREEAIVASGRADHVIHVSEFIRLNYRDVRLFNTFNHPTKAIYWHLIREILKAVKIDTTSHAAMPEIESHSEFIPAIPKYIRTVLALSFDDDTPHPSRQTTVYDYLREYRTLSNNALLTLRSKLGHHPLEGDSHYVKGWSGAEATHRWAIASKATIVLKHWSRLPKHHVVAFYLLGAQRQNVKVSLNGKPIGVVHVDGSHAWSYFVAQDVVMTPMENAITLESDCEPLQAGGPDTRYLSFAVRDFSAISNGTAWGWHVVPTLLLHVLKRVRARLPRPFGGALGAQS